MHELGNARAVYAEQRLERSDMPKSPALRPAGQDAVAARPAGIARATDFSGVTSGNARGPLPFLARCGLADRVAAGSWRLAQPRKNRGTRRSLALNSVAFAPILRA